MKQKICVVGAGFSGAVIGYTLAEAGYQVDVYESRDHLGGNCFTYRDSATGILIHKYGPHIFHTDNREVWDFVNRFEPFQPFVHRVKAVYDDSVFLLPVNLHSINQLYGTNLNPAEARELIEREADRSIEEPISFEEQALRFIGPKLYRAFFYGYTKKQWGCEPSQLPASILKRLPVRFNYDDRYFSNPYQGMPANGYTPIFEKLLDHPNIRLTLNTEFEGEATGEYLHTFYSGPLDKFFGYRLGELGYRTLDFVAEVHAGDYQGCPVLNYCDQDVPYTRITEHKHFAPWESHADTVIYKEYARHARRDDIPYYPIRLVDDKNILGQYCESALRKQAVTFVGRLGTYRYLDMDKTIEEALHVARSFLQLARSGKPCPAFFHSPI